MIGCNSHVNLYPCFCLTNMLVLKYLISFSEFANIHFTPDKKQHILKSFFEYAKFTKKIITTKKKKSTKNKKCLCKYQGF